MFLFHYHRLIQGKTANSWKNSSVYENIVAKENQRVNKMQGKNNPLL